MLHGAGQSAEIGIAPFLPLADAAGAVLVAPDSRGGTWDFLYGPYGADVQFIDRALAHVFERCAIDPSRVVIEGFSDGASYALSLGITNGDLFSRVIAFSPCILQPAAEVGHPRIFISHGTADHILPIDSCGRRLAARLATAGYDVDFHEFAGPHRVPPEMAQAAIEWMEQTGS
jgi:phospholipase/carboxylesterase